MKKNTGYALGIAGSIASIVGLLLFFLPKDGNEPAAKQVQSGTGNLQIGRDLIVNRFGESTRDDGIFLYEEKVEIYWNDWWAHPLQSRKTRDKYGHADLTITGEGKTVDFRGIISMNCENGKFHWVTASNFGKSIEGDSNISMIVPKQVTKNIYKLFCRDK